MPGRHQAPGEILGFPTPGRVLCSASRSGLGVGCKSQGSYRNLSCPCCSFRKTAVNVAGTSPGPPHRQARQRESGAPSPSASRHIPNPGGSLCRIAPNTWTPLTHSSTASFPTAASTRPRPSGRSSTVRSQSRPVATPAVVRTVRQPPRLPSFPLPRNKTK